jgi:UDP-glucose 4-epimerase
MRFLIFGGSGYLGSHLVDVLAAENHELVVFDNSSGKVASEFGFPVHTLLGDVTNMDDFKKIQGGFDGVFHLAAKKSVAESFTNPELYSLTNELGSNNVFNFCLGNNIKNIVFTSSAAVYGNSDSSLALAEDFPVMPINPYGVSKLNAERALSQLSSKKLINAISLRIFNIVGTGNRNYLDRFGENVLPILTRKLIEGNFFTLFGNDYRTPDGTCVRDYVNVKDVAMAHVLAMKYLMNRESHSEELVLNISSGQGISILDLIKKLENLSGINLKLEFGEKRDGDPASVIGNNNLAKEVLGWIPQYSIDESIFQTIEGFKALE